MAHVSHECNNTITIIILLLQAVQAPSDMAHATIPRIPACLGKWAPMQRTWRFAHTSLSREVGPDLRVENVNGDCVQLSRL